MARYIFIVPHSAVLMRAAVASVGNVSRAPLTPSSCARSNSRAVANSDLRRLILAIVLLMLAFLVGPVVKLRARGAGGRLTDQVTTSATGSPVEKARVTFERAAPQRCTGAHSFQAGLV